MSYPAPYEFGLPEKFREWRPEQLQAIERIAVCPHRFTCHALPTGSGKSLAAMGAATILGARVAYLTSTKGLQKQLRDDFSETGLVDIRGQGNYRCRLLADDDYTGACDHGPCHAGFACEYRMRGCDYYDSVIAANRARSIITNYRYWVMTHRASLTAKAEPDEHPLGKFDMLILDECHNAPDELGDALSFEISKLDTESILSSAAPWGSEEVFKWKQWSTAMIDRLERRMFEVGERLKLNPYTAERRYYKQMKDLDRKLKELNSLRGDWVVDIDKGKAKFSPVWPADYAEDLFQHIPKVILLSATVRPKTADLIGVARDQMSFFEYESSFPLESRRVTHIPTVRMNHRTTEDELRTWLRRIDQIIGGRLDRKGIVHTVSYDRRNRIMSTSDYSQHMISHDTNNATFMVEKFKNARPPAILISPSVSTGYDFPMDLCRYQIIGKLAFIDTRNKIAKARCDADPEYSPYIAMQELVQACGRGSRSADDFCETMVIDDNVSWFLKKYKAFAPKWFLDSFKKAVTVPEPPRLK